jgi:hypothetical protein
VVAVGTLICAHARVFEHAGPDGHKRSYAALRVAFHSVNGVGIRDEHSFAAQWLANALPTDASPLPSRTTTHGSGPIWVAAPSS